MIDRLAFKQRVLHRIWPLVPVLQRIRYGGPNPIEPWSTDPEFLRIFQSMRDRTLVDHVRCFMIYQLAQQALRTDGDFAEVGVYRGGTARLLAELAATERRTVHLFDTFTGMPETDPDKDWHRSGDFDDTSESAVRAFLAGFPGVEFHAGVFPATATAVEDRRFAFVHIDADIYTSVRDSCEFFYGRLESGGILLFDDYGQLTCPGARIAVDEFCSAHRMRPIYLTTGQCLVIRTARSIPLTR